MQNSANNESKNNDEKRECDRKKGFEKERKKEGEINHRNTESTLF